MQYGIFNRWRRDNKHSSRLSPAGWFEGAIWHRPHASVAVQRARSRWWPRRWGHAETSPWWRRSDAARRGVVSTAGGRTAGRTTRGRLQGAGYIDTTPHLHPTPVPHPHTTLPKSRTTRGRLQEGGVYRHHPSPPPYPCTTLPKSRTTRGQLQGGGVYRHHLSPPPYPCTTLPKSRTTRGRLQGGEYMDTTSHAPNPSYPHHPTAPPLPRSGTNHPQYNKLITYKTSLVQYKAGYRLQLVKQEL